MRSTYGGSLPDYQLQEVARTIFWALTPTWTAFENLREFVEGTCASIGWVMRLHNESHQEAKQHLREALVAQVQLQAQSARLERRLHEHAEDELAHLMRGSFAYRSNKAVFEEYANYIPGPWAPHYDVARILFESIHKQLLDVRAQLAGLSDALKRCSWQEPGWQANADMLAYLSKAFHGFADDLGRHLSAQSAVACGVEADISARIRAARDEAARSRGCSRGSSKAPSRAASLATSGHGTPRCTFECP